MKHPQKTFYKASLLLIIILFVSCFSKEDETSRVKVTTSIFPLLEFARAVCGERGEVELLVPPGAEVHTWTPRPSDIKKLFSSDIFIYIGANLEPWIEDILKSLRAEKIKIIEASRGIPLLELEKEEQHKHPLDYPEERKSELLDPHIWLDFSNAEMIVEKIQEALSEIDPESQELYRKNANLYKHKLQMLDQKFKNALQRCSQKTFIFGGHAAFGYLARRYGLRQVSLYGLSPNSKPTPQQLIEIINLAKECKAKVIFFETQISKELAEVVAKEAKAETLLLNPGANISRKQLESRITFLEIMEENLKNLRYGLDCQ